MRSASVTLLTTRPVGCTAGRERERESEMSVSIRSRPSPAFSSPHPLNHVPLVCGERSRCCKPVWWYDGRFVGREYSSYGTGWLLAVGGVGRQPRN